MTIKYNTNGVIQWASAISGPASSTEWANTSSIVVDEWGNVYVTGTSQSDYFTISYDSTGNERWTARYNGPPNNYPLDYASMLVLDKFGSLYVTGCSKGIDTDYDYATVKYDAATGREIWVARFDGQGTNAEEDQAEAICVDDSGYVYVTGSSWGTGYEGPTYLTIKYDSAGAIQWKVRTDRMGGDYPASLKLDKEGAVYVTGIIKPETSADSDISTVKYDRHGVQQWIMKYSYDGSSDDVVSSIAVDSTNNVIVSGTSKKSFGSVFTTIKYTQVPTVIKYKMEYQPNSPLLYQNYPNPFNQSTTIKYYIEQSAFVTLKIYDIRGRLIRVLLDKKIELVNHLFSGMGWTILERQAQAEYIFVHYT